MLNSDLDLVPVPYPNVAFHLTFNQRSKVCKSPQLANGQTKKFRFLLAGHSQQLHGIFSLEQEEKQKQVH